MRMVHSGGGIYVLDQAAADELTRRIRCHRQIEECYDILDDGTCAYAEAINDEIIPLHKSKIITVVPHTYVSIRGNYDSGYNFESSDIRLDHMAERIKDLRTTADVFEAYLIERT